MGAELLAVQGRMVSGGQSYRGPGAFRRLMLSGVARLRYPGSEAEQLLLAPQDLRTADPSFSTEIYNGHFGLAGTHAVIGSHSPFAIMAPSEAWARELHGFGWLRNLRAAGNALAQEQARTLFTEWVKQNRSFTGLAWRPDVVARRVISWLANCMVVLDTENADAYHGFMRELTSHLRYLSATHREAPDGAPRLVSVMALVYGGLCIAEQQAVTKRYTRPLAKELERQILPDGSHISRNPIVLVELLLDLLPLRQCFVARDYTPPEELTSAIDRAMTALRFFRFRDGDLGRFNGTGATPSDALATLLAYDEAQAHPPRAATVGKYGRLERGSSVLLADIGAAPPITVSRQAAAGCLSFELVVDGHPVIVNCGAPGPENSEFAATARATSAHSTVTVEEDSSGLFERAGQSAPVRADATLIGPPEVSGEVIDEGEALELKGRHEGYKKTFGLAHSRQIVLAATGALVSGRDTLSPVGPRAKGVPVGPLTFAVRFHLHPEVRASLMPGGRSIELVLRNGEVWQLSSNAKEVGLESSLYFGDERGPRDSLQVVLSGSVGDKETRISWSIERVSASARRTAETAARTPELV
ncbi:Heparinase II/III-like protein [Methyloligella halotolerans]|uniref:Heparinase II/III-like protein n=1 Tax=Methyloligella halotolerans TaxID=1177755 RepID=A0A1E2S0C3_9HYPH|nr:heparinase II/III family protein [Methyloligella halotolerans]ODA67946.1 Heparinase II/III-like protein [Methyloligella halotolerans]